MIIIISSPSGAGKTSICKKILENDQKIKISISDTTRIPRDNEVNGKDYNFISKEEFKRKIINNEYAEYAKVFGNYYGSLHKNLTENLNNGYDILFDIDWQGAQQLKEIQYTNLLSFFIMPPSKDEIFKRLLSRAKISGDNENAINLRMSQYDTEVKRKNEYDHTIINQDLDECVIKIEQIISERRKNLGINS